MDFLKSKKGIFVFGIIAGIGAAILAATGNPKNMAFCIACFIRDSAGAMKMHNAEIVQYFRPEIVGLVLGSFIISLASREYRATAGSSPVIRFLLGVIMMIGALVFLGCPLRMVLRMSAGDISSYIGIIGFIGGVGTGAYMLKKGFSLGRSYTCKKENGYIFPAILVFLFIISIATSLFVVSVKGPGSMSAPVALSLGVGLLFGVIAQKTRMCFAGSIRDIILLKDFTLLSVIGGLFLTMLVYNIATGNFKFVSFGPIAHAQTLWNILGMYVVGFAAVLLGGCPLRQLILSGSGSSDSVVTVLGMFVGSAICHNFGLAAKGAALKTAEKAAEIGGPGPNGKVAIIICIVVLFVISAIGIMKEKKASI
ncbi:YedE family putative selenium transporter [Peptostreptococcus anaerobius]|uniref:YedE family putative selenium transporter n=1 Tax=Peptostreptococcus anaerobius TaxID=1261 RepID=UPI002904E1EE|nr:YedE family putative selenium transporter [Peptostreptococcus anaerobius]MDU1598604.1 YedE family putative selenium transporter [Peptostreptococcus anaerobius]MDU1682309.1 YedE family putative selenium transporter [Peptostreptococcus anaerobius]